MNETVKNGVKVRNVPTLTLRKRTIKKVARAGKPGAADASYSCGCSCHSA